MSSSVGVDFEGRHSPRHYQHDYHSRYAIYTLCYLKLPLCTIKWSDSSALYAFLGQNLLS